MEMFQAFPEIETFQM